MSSSFAFRSVLWNWICVQAFRVSPVSRSCCAMYCGFWLDRVWRPCHCCRRVCALAMVSDCRHQPRRRRTNCPRDYWNSTCGGWGRPAAVLGSRRPVSRTGHGHCESVWCAIHCASPGWRSCRLCRHRHPIRTVAVETDWRSGILSVRRLLMGDPFLGWYGLVSGVKYSWKEAINRHSIR